MPNIRAVAKNTHMIELISNSKKIAAKVTPVNAAYNKIRKE